MGITVDIFHRSDISPRSAHFWKITEDLTELLSAVTQCAPTDSVGTNSLSYFCFLKKCCHFGLLHYCMIPLWGVNISLNLAMPPGKDFSNLRKYQLKVSGKSLSSVPFNLIGCHVLHTGWLMAAMVLIPCQAAFKSPLLY